MTDRDRILSRLIGAELLLYVSRGGKLVTRLMELHYAQALAAMSLDYVPTPGDLTRLLQERLPQGWVKPARPLGYRRETPRQKRKRLAEQQVPIAAERRTA